MLARSRPNDPKGPPISRVYRRSSGGLVLLAAAVALIAVLPAAAAGPATAGAAAPAASTGVWAWGAYDAAGSTDVYYGAYTDALNLTNANLSHSISDIEEVASDRAMYSSYTVVNATAPSASTRSVEFESVAEANYTGIVEVTGNLPATGTYAPGAPVELVNDSGVYYASAIDLAVYLAFANYTYVNGTLALANESVESWTIANATTILYHWPGYVDEANGSVTVTSTTEAAVAVEWVAETFRASFSPALPLSKAPLALGETWNASTTATVVGWDEASVASAFWSASTNTSSANTATSSLNTTAVLGFSFTVAGSEEIVFPNGTTGTGYEISVTENGTGAPAYTLWDGLAVLPASDAPSPPAALPRAQAEDVPITGAGTTTSESVVTGGGFPVATKSAASGSTVLSTAPLPSGQVTGAIASTQTPAAPAGVSAPAVSDAPTLSGTPPANSSPSTSNPPAGSNPGTPGTGQSPTTPSTTAPAAADHLAVAPWVLGLAVGTLAVAALGAMVLRRRAPPA